MNAVSTDVRRGNLLTVQLLLRELSDMGVSNIITFDAHDPRVQNSIPLNGFDNFFPTYQFLKALVKNVVKFQVDNESPDDHQPG